MTLKFKHIALSVTLALGLSQAAMATEGTAAPLAQLVSQSATTSPTDKDLALAFGQESAMTLEQMAVLTPQEMTATDGTLMYLRIVGALVWYGGQVAINLYKTHSGYGLTPRYDVMYRGNSYAGVHCHMEIQYSGTAKRPIQVCGIGG
jgi:hypothetical protein